MRGGGERQEHQSPLDRMDQEYEDREVHPEDRLIEQEQPEWVRLKQQVTWGSQPGNNQLNIEKQFRGNRSVTVLKPTK